MKQKKISLWCEDIQGFYSLKPIVIKYKSKNYKIYIYIIKKNIKNLKLFLGDLTNIEIISIESINNFFLKILNFIFRNFLTNPNFGGMYLKKKNYKFKFYHKLLGNFFYIENYKINSFFYNFFSIFNNKIKSNFLITISRVRSSHLICSKHIKHISVMESWDHPIKTPYYYLPDIILTWNRDLKKDIQKYQNFYNRKIFFIKPLKFRYIEERLVKDLNELEKSLTKKKYINELKLIKKRNVIVYPTFTSSAGTAKSHHAEMQIIDMICATLEKLNKVLYIKPKPNGPTGDYDVYKNKYKNVIVGVYASDKNWIDMLDDEYHTFRYLMFKYSSLIINLGTTFVLEACLMDKPILQMNFLENENRELAFVSKNKHIKKYLLTNDAYLIKNENSFENIMTLKQNNFLNYSKKLKSWLGNK